MPLLRMCLLGLAVLTSGLLIAADKEKPAAKEKAKPKGEDFSGQDLSGKKYKGKQLRYANFEESVLKQTDFEGADLTGANFQGAQIYFANFSDADLTEADFRNATLEYPTLARANLTAVNFEKVDLSKTSFNEVKLRKVNFRNSKGLGSVYDLDLSECDFRGANLVGMKFNERTRFRKAKYDTKTRWPKDFDVEASGVVLEEKPSEEDVQKEFAKLDANEDGRLSGKEMRGLDDYDANKDGRVTLEEFVAGRKKE